MWKKTKECSSSKIDRQCQFLKEHIKQITNCPADRFPNIAMRISKFMFSYRQKWQKSGRNEKMFIRTNRDWLDIKMVFPKFVIPKIGRPKTSFQECSESTKRQKTTNIRNENTVEAICYAAQMELRKAGHLEASKLIREISSNPTMASQYLNALKKTKENHIIQLSPNEALSVLVEAGLSRSQYNLIREKDKLKFPSYKVVQKAKNSCYPNTINVTSTSAEVSLESLLKHTTERIITLQEDVLDRFGPEELKNAFLVCKWGFDGTSGQQNYKLKFDNLEDSDSSAFVTWLVPLKLVLGNPESEDPHKIIWQNLSPSSPRYCRPIRIQFVRESTEVCKQEQSRIETELKNIDGLTFEIREFVLYVRFILLLAMIDGKVRNALTNNKSTQRCYICQYTQKDFNDLNLILAKKCDSTLYNFSLPVLHARIRCFEFFLSLAYKLPVKVWRSRSQDEKLLIAENKKRIQQEFKSHLGLIIDQPKQGYGSSNDGNTARCFFENAEITCKITRIDIDVIKRFSVILEVISSYHSINIENFRNYALETARLLTEKFSWYCMTPTVHLILLHGADIIKSGLVPVGQLSEEAAESRNKDLKQYRSKFARKTSRKANNEDVLKRLLLSSDPLITGLRKPPKLSKKHFSNEALSMLLPPDFSYNALNKETDSDSDNN